MVHLEVRGQGTEMYIYNGRGGDVGRGRCGGRASGSKRHVSRRTGTIEQTVRSNEGNGARRPG
jgi:hypothetical protein